MERKRWRSVSEIEREKGNRRGVQLYSCTLSVSGWI